MGVLALSLSVMLALVPPSSAASLPSVPPCSVKRHGKVKEPATLDAMLQCQKNALQKASDDWVTRHSAQVPEGMIDRWMDQQRAEMRAYIARHPDASIDDSQDAKPQAAASTPEKPAAASQPQDPAQAEADAFKKQLWAESDGGKNGVTPQMAQQMAQRIEAQQGYVSPEMQALLDAVSKDGARLTPDTVNKLKAAAQDANASGLDLGVSPDMQKVLLENDQGQPAN